jgi:hypothetical protein
MPFKEVKADELWSILGPTSSVRECLLLCHKHGCPPCVDVYPEFQKAGEQSDLHWYAIEREEASKEMVIDGITRPPMLWTLNLQGFPSIYYLNVYEVAPIEFQGQRKQAVLNEFAEQYRNRVSCDCMSAK